MDLKSVNHVYQVAPPYMGNQQRPLQLMDQVLHRLKAESPELSDQELWSKASAEVEAMHAMIWFGVTGISMPETDVLERQIQMLYRDHNVEKAGELEAQRRIELVKKHVVSINNLTIDGEEVKDFDTFYAKAPKELVRWICDAVHSQLILSAAERKNFMPESVSPV